MVLSITRISDVFSKIITNAFDLKAIFGGFSGSCVIYGIKRGLFSNEPTSQSLDFWSNFWGSAHKKVKNIYYVIASLVIFVGAILSADFLWNFADMTMGIMTLINMPVLFLLCKYSNRALKDYEAQKKLGLSPEFRPNSSEYQFEEDVWGHK